MIFTRRGVDIDSYPAVKAHLSMYRDQLEPKPSGWDGPDWPGRKSGSYQWYETQDPVEYWQLFDSPKIIYQVIQFYPNYSLDLEGKLSNDKTFFIPTSDLYILGVLNSAVLWWHNWRFLTHLKDEALSPMGYMMEDLPVASPTVEIRDIMEVTVARLIEIAKVKQSVQRDILDWLQVQHGISEVSSKLGNSIALGSDAFVAEVQKARGKKNLITAAGLRSLRDEHAHTIEPARLLAAEALQLEYRLHDLANEAYGLTSEEVGLMWDTAPPRMPIPRPASV